MSTAHVVVTVLAILANAAVAIADLARADFVLANSAEVHVPLSWVPALSALKAAGAVGLLLGLVGAPAVGTAAAAGLVVFFVGAVGVHVRHRVWHNIAAPGTFLALSVACLVLGLAGQPA
ncbi:DoxX family protein [Saccharothrix sp. 6-C]|uniref:DoxX family protein n=1 Tax=Saccharothrix sp. 6-C TaxID=2781735 RepID=UPI001916D7EE|nr:DoxX family protein [Saccharothrix sp. 6-C]QQQ75404.1 DoxX family protein [Saccharothrix sp. 6-C]